MKYKSKEFPFFGFHKNKEYLVKITGIYDYATGEQYHTHDMPGWYKNSLRVPTKDIADHEMSAAHTPAEIASKMIEPKDIPIKSKRKIIENLFRNKFIVSE